MNDWNAALGTRESLIGREDLLELAYTQLYPMVYSTALRVTGPADAEDIAQEVFVTLHEQFEKLQVPKLPGWLKRTTLLHALNHVRKQGRHAARLASHMDTPESSRSDGNIVAALAVAELLEQLPDDLRVVLHAKYLTELTLEEIAEMLGISIAAAARRVKKALAVAKRM